MLQNPAFDSQTEGTMRPLTPHDRKINYQVPATITTGLGISDDQGQTTTQCMYNLRYRQWGQYNKRYQ